MITRIKTTIFALAALALMAASPVFAEDTISQGEAALLLAQRLGLSAQTTRPLTQLEAVKLLMENRISPFGGWDVDAPLMDNDLARILVQALGKAGEIPEEDRDDPDTTAYNDLLLRDADLDLSSISAALAGSGARPDPAGSGLAGDTTSTDPLRGRPGDTDEQTGGAPAGAFIPVTEAMIVEAIQQVVPSRGGGRSGRPSPTVSDTTPSQPN